MKEKFDLLLNEYLKDDSILVNSSKDYYIEFVKELPLYLYKYFDKNKYLIKASLGIGQKSEIPWLCIFNRDITTTATKGIYICYLFRKDMSGFYLILGQGITTFKEIYGKDKYKNINKVAEYFRNLIDDNKFSKSDIDLKGLNELAKGYEKGAIISKYYAKDNYLENELINDLIEFKNIYDDICENLNGSSYMEIVLNIIQNTNSNYINIKEARKIIEKKLFEESSKKEIEVPLLKEIEIPKNKKVNKYFAMTKNNIKKIDYLKKTKSNIDNGFLGEELVMKYERDRLCKLGREDLADNIEWVSTINDETGYDIISFDIDEYYNVKEKYIEVKATEGNDNSIFYISKNEINTMERLKEKYFIYRVFNLNSKNPLVYILNYDDFKNRIKLEVNSYMASIK